MHMVVFLAKPHAQRDLPVCPVSILLQWEEESVTRDATTLRVCQYWIWKEMVRNLWEVHLFLSVTETKTSVGLSASSPTPPPAPTPHPRDSATIPLFVLRNKPNLLPPLNLSNALLPCVEVISNGSP